MNNILVGADPEVFVQQNGVFVSAHGMIPGDKKNPFPVLDGAVQVDGMALEFNIHPAATPDEFQRYITHVMEQMTAMIPADTSIIIQPTADFTQEHMDAQPPEAKELGCEPDFSAYTMDANPRPNGDVLFRTGSGHVHLGFCEGADTNSEEHRIRCATLVKHLDLYLGLPSLLWDSDSKRRKLYGGPGAFRPKSYGVEYRTMSNAWLSDERLMRYVFNQTVAAVESLKSGGRKTDEEYMEYAGYIAASDANEAEWVLENNGIALPPVIQE